MTIATKAPIASCIIPLPSAGFSDRTGTMAGKMVEANINIVNNPRRVNNMPAISRARNCCQHTCLRKAILGIVDARPNSASIQRVRNQHQMTKDTSQNSIPRS